jgi:chromosome segregation ATPase
LQFRREKVDASNLSSKTKELETALDDTRRKLVEERQLKDNFEDLLTAMRVELEQLRNERDHFRDEVLPQLAKGRFNAIAEEEGVPQRGSMIGLSRSNSVARMPMRANGARSGSLSRSNSVTGKDRESRESLVDRVKDVEAQRDALHKALKSLLDRQAYQARENEKRIRILEIELEQAEQFGSPRKLGYEREVRNLREEINHLRRRADEALEQKWQCEKGLGGLKMDLDRAEQETSSLRALLQEHDIALPDHLAATQEGLAIMQATSSSLEAAYQQLQADMEYAEANAPRSLQEEQMLAAQLTESVSRTEALAGQVRQQLGTNSALRTRLADAIAKGEREQKLSASRIYEMQNKLKNLEDTILIAQQHSEEEIAKHEEEVRALKDNHNAQLTRAKNGIKTPVTLSPRPPASPFSGSRSPRIDKTTSGDGIPLSQLIQAEKLEMKVKELEKALRDADFEMEEVVGRMNKAQMEVAELQSDRYDAHPLPTFLLVYCYPSDADFCLSEMRLSARRAAYKPKSWLSGRNSRLSCAKP